MKIIATIKGCSQVGEDLYNDYLRSYIFNSSDSIDYMLTLTGAKHLSDLNLSEIIEQQGDTQ